MKYKLVIKRLLDVTFACLALLVFSPLLLLLMLVIKFSSFGPIFFRQQRIGKNGQLFFIYKFRTMIPNAENLGSGLAITDNHDPRVTRVGRWLRQTGLDELPQLFNVINGSMSLVGPRPPAVYHPYHGYQAYPDWSLPRFNMRPGITGLTQVSVRNSVFWDERIQIDLRYIKDFSLLLDFQILFKTLYQVIHPQAIHLEKSDYHGN